MNLAKSVRAATPWTVLAVSTTLMATIVVVAPEVGRELVLALTGAWIVLAALRVIVIVEVARRLYRRLGASFA